MFFWKKYTSIGKRLNKYRHNRLKTVQYNFTANNNSFNRLPGVILRLFFFGSVEIYCG